MKKGKQRHEEEDKYLQIDENRLSARSQTIKGSFKTQTTKKGNVEADKVKREPTYISSDEESKEFSDDADTVDQREFVSKKSKEEIDFMET